MYVPEEMHACGSKGLGGAVFGGDVPSSRRASQMVRAGERPLQDRSEGRSSLKQEGTGWQGWQMDGCV